MKKHLFNDGSTVPTAFVTKGRQRVKQYNDKTVYLEDKTEFEIELFNPTTNKILAKIELDGKSLGSGIVLRPGERVFLERYLNEPRKFLFETYEVDKNNNDVMKAIANNGKVEVMFYDEITNYFIYPTHAHIHHHWDYTYPTYTAPVPYTYTLGNSTHAFQSCSKSFENNQEDELCYASIGNTIETGRVEKGSNSNQSFTYDNTSFNTWWSWKSEWKILPLSQKPIEVKDIKVFCTKCGSKQKKHTHLFCPNCGTKY
jgi:hypothetical protein